MIRLLLLPCLLLVGAQSASAQTASTGLGGPARSQLFAFGARPAPVTTRDTVAKAIPPTQWKSGMLIGGGLGALMLGYAGNALCNDGDGGSDDSCFGSTVGSALLGAAVGGTVGALIGGMVPMHQATDRREPGP
jgi:hypothetical protein